MKKGLILTILTIFIITSASVAEEGMWLLTQLKDLNLRANGLKIPIEKIWSPDNPCLANATVLLGGGTASFVSYRGLLLTNHHVAFTAVQRASTKGTDFLTTGFLARSQEQEIEAPGYSARVLQRIEDVTKKVARAGRRHTDPVSRQKAIDKAIKKITDKVEKGKTDIDARVVDMYNGKQYILFVYKRYDDVRVVYMPPMAVGNYGGEIDNWMWPRHTGDFAFMRVYAAPDGTGRRFHRDNVPLRPRHWVPISRTPLKDGDFTFILGFPGGTVRYRTSNSVEYNLTYNYPQNVNNFKEIIELLEEITKDDPQGRIKVSNLIKGLANAMKNYQGNIDGMKKSNFLQKKRDLERELTTYLQQDSQLYAKHGDILNKIKALYDELKKTREYDQAFGNFGGLSGTLLRTAMHIYYTVRERAKPVKERDPYFSERDVKRSVDRLKYSYLSYYEPADKALLKRALRKASELPTEQRIKGLSTIVSSPNRIDQFVSNAYQNTRLTDVEFVKTLYYKSAQELEAMDDPFINLARDLYGESEAARKKAERFNANITQLRKRFIDALYDWKGKGLYPDANRTLRFSWGRVAGYRPRDAVWYKPFTYLAGAVEKDTGKEPFNLPPQLKILYQNKNFGSWTAPGVKDVPIAFTHKVDSTGGNSGSPVFNANGELVGILFDGNYEAMTGDWQYDDAIQRSISVDIRYVMFITEKLGGADFLLKELGLR